MKAVNHSWWVGAIISTVLTFAFLGSNSSMNFGLILFIGIVNGVFWGFVIGLIIDNISGSQKHPNTASGTDNELKPPNINANDNAEGQTNRKSSNIESDIGLNEQFTGDRTAKDVIMEELQINVDNSIEDYRLKNKKELDDPLFGPIKLINYINTTSEELKKALLKTKETLGLTAEEVNEIVENIHRNTFQNNLVTNQGQEDLTTEKFQEEESDFMGPDIKSTAKQEDITKISELLVRFSRDSNVYNTLIRNSISVYELTKARPFLKILQTYVEERLGSTLQIGIRQLRFNTCSFKYNYKVVDLNKINGQLIFFSNALSDMEAIEINKHIILCIENNEVTRWMFVEETSVAHLTNLYMLNENGEVINCGKLPDAKFKTVYDELERRLEKTPSKKDWDNLMDEFYNKI